MATRSFIARYDHDTETYTAIYCHWDGYPQGVGLALRDNYSWDEAVQTLLGFGDISSLRDTLAETKQEAFKVTRGEDTPALTFNYQSDMVEHYRKCWCEYGYIWIPTQFAEDGSGEWSCLSLNVHTVNLYEMEVANV